MSKTALVFIPPRPPSTSSSANISPLQEISEALYANFFPTTLPAWSLDHRLFFDTSSLLPNAQSPRHFMQYVALSYHPGKVFVGCTQRDAKEEPLPQHIIAAPASVQTDDFFMFTALRKMEPLWNLRAMVKVDGGLAFELKDWRVRLGELKQSGAQGPRSRGWVVEIACKETEEEANEEKFQDEVRDFWADVGKDVDGMKIFTTQQQDIGGDNKFASIKLWMEVLRMR